MFKGSLSKVQERALSEVISKMQMTVAESADLAWEHLKLVAIMLKNKAVYDAMNKQRDEGSIEEIDPTEYSIDELLQIIGKA